MPPYSKAPSPQEKEVGVEFLKKVEVERNVASCPRTENSYL
jgi:hypothetical protein